MTGDSRKWSADSMRLVYRKAHSQSLISTSQRDDKTFYTSSEDNTLRLWDLRTLSSVKLFRHPSLKDLTNCQNDSRNILFVGSGRKLISFDARQQAIFVENIFTHAEEQHYDELSSLKYNLELGTLAACDDEGDVRLYTRDLHLKQSLEQGHTNICNSVDFMLPEKGEPLCLSGGFDCKLLMWSIKQEKCLKTVALQDLFKKYHISLPNPYPFIHHIFCHASTAFLSIDSGHVICLKASEPKKPKFILEASLVGVIRTQLCKFNMELMVVLTEGAFSLFNYVKREDGIPNFVQKFKTEQQPTWIQTMEQHILVCTQSAQLGVYSLK